MMNTMMNTKKSSLTAAVIALLLLTLLMTLLLSCSSKPTAGSERVDTSLSITIPKSSLVDRIDLIRLQIIVEDEVVDERETQLVDGRFDFGTISIPTGQVIFVVEAIENSIADAPEHVLYANTAIIEVEPGDEVTVPITLLPAVPMVKLTPYHDQATSQTLYSTTIELWRIGSFNNGIFRIAYDTDHFQFANAVQANSAWGTLDILADFEAGEVFLDVNRPLGLETIPVTTELVRVNFNVLDAGTATLDLSVDAMSNNSGIIPELVAGVLFVDDATVVISAEGSSGNMQGTVVNASNNNPIPNADVTLSGPVSRQATTNALGQFSFTDLPFGTYQLHVVADGFISRTSTQVVDELDEQVTVALSTQLGEGEFRIILSWSSQPEDIDAHYYTVVDNILFSVDYVNTGSADQLPYAVLDVDDQDGFGPETITVYDLVGPAAFAVHNYDQDAGGTATFAQSQAKVEVYSGSSLLQTFTVSPSATQLWWYVFNLSQSGTITTVNTYSDSPPSFAFKVGEFVPETPLMPKRVAGMLK